MTARGPSDVEILLVEDCPHDAEMKIRSLPQHRFANRLHHVRDWAEALEFPFATGTYAGRDTSNRPKGDGLEVLKKKSDESTRTVPVVVLASSDEEANVLKSHRLGVTSYAVKPVDFDKVAEAVAKLGLCRLLLNLPPGARRPE